jgi:heme/copper-type cytochrome/quinol oxidase subunit 2
MALRMFYAVLAFVFTLAVCVIAFYAIYSLLNGVPSKEAVEIDYNAILTVLLTTVTVIFTVCAIILAVLGVFGFQNLKRDAGRYAETQALAEIAKAFGPKGSGTIRIEQEMLNEDGHHRQFVEKRIRAEVISLLPLIADRINDEALRMDIGEPTDEGEVD